MSLKFSRRSVLKGLGLVFCTPVFSRIASAAQDEWVLGFGSCMSLRRSQKFWNSLLGRQYNQWVFLGDSLYPEHDTLDGLTQAYAELGALRPFHQLLEKVPVTATWDDHDFGADNADSSLPFRQESFALFRKFWKQSYASESDGVYSAQMFEHQGRKIHLILLDLRYNRTPYRNIKTIHFGVASNNELNFREPQLLGAAQWAWLEAELEKPADLKIIGSSIQVLSSEHNFEKWKNYPAEYDRLMANIGRITAPTVFLSGDRHLHEISKSQLVSGRTLYDFTSSGFNKADALSRFERNRMRVERCLDDGFGELRVSWQGTSPLVTMQMVDDKGDIRFSMSDTLV